MCDNNDFIELFAGCGGLSSGLIKAGFNPILLVDNNKDCIETLKLNHPDIKILKEDVTKLNLIKYNKKVFLLAAGIPCQSWSFAGKRLGLHDPRGNLFIEFIRLVKQCNPEIFLIENVHGLLTHNKGETFKYLKNLLSINNTYEIHYKLLNANNFNVPQNRKRVFIVGTQKSQNIYYDFPQEEQNSLTLMDAFKNIKKTDKCGFYSLKKIELFKKIPEGGCWINLTEQEQKDYLGKSFFSGGGKRGILRRLDMNKPSLTLLTSPQQKQTERCHPLENRPLNIFEYARIQTFHDDYKFFGTINSVYKQIGNAVPVNLAYSIGLSIKNIGYII